MGLGETTDDFGHVTVCVIIRRADTQRTFQPVVIEGGHGFVVEANDAAGIMHQLFAFRRQPVAAPVFCKKLFAQPLFKPSHLHRDGGLRLENPVCRFGEAAGINDGDEGVQLVNIEGCGHGVPSIRMIDA